MNIIQNRNYLKISHLNFSKYIFQIKMQENIFRWGPKFSSKNETYHSELFVKKILVEIESAKKS